MRKICVIAALAVAACSTAPETNEARLVRACADSGWFKVVGGVAVIAVPQAALPAAIINAGVEQVCANPSAYANDAARLAQTIAALRETVRRQ